MGEIMQTDKEGLCVKCGEPEKAHRPLPGCLYNGWTNYETWAVKLWIDNEEPSYNYWREAAQDALENPVENQFMELDRRQVHALMERLKDEHEEAAQERTSESGIFADLLNAALSEVNWYEIAESLLEDVREASEVQE